MGDSSNVLGLDGRSTFGVLYMADIAQICVCGGCASQESKCASLCICTFRGAHLR